MDIMTESQNAGETAQEYGTRLLSINATLQEKIPDAILKQIYVRGVNSTGCRSFLLREVSAATNMPFAQLVQKAREFDMQEQLVNQVDGLNANVQRNGRNQNNQNHGRGNRNDGNVNRNGRNNAQNQQNGNGQRLCDFCARPNHTWKQCFLLLAASRPANANHERMDAKRDELLAACNPAD